MNRLDTNAVLNRLLVLHHRSLPTFLSYARPWDLPPEADSEEALRLIVADHQRTVDRLAELIEGVGGTVSKGEFPLRYTALHDLSFAYLIRCAVQYEQQLLQEIEEAAQALPEAALARAVVEEILGQAKGHLESLRDLIAIPAAGGR
jgi:hypothetical protein